MVPRSSLLAWSAPILDSALAISADETLASRNEVTTDNAAINASAPTGTT
jgi:hypothetical protein